MLFCEYKQDIKDNIAKLLEEYSIFFVGFIG